MFRIIFIFLFSFNVYALDNLKVLIPLYSVPSLWIEQIEKLKSIKDKEITTYAIINPNNGPGEKEQQDYIDGIKLLKEHNIHVIGYVYTLYGKRDPNIVKEDIYKWSSFYQEYGLEGIFFDETDNKVDSLEFYKDLTTYSKTHDFNFNILNPGYTIDEAFIDQNIAELIVTYENSYKNWENSFPTVKNQENEKTKLSLLLHSMEKDGFGIVMHKAKSQGFSYIYLTEDKDSNPWDSISEYFLKYF